MDPDFTKAFNEFYREFINETATDAVSKLTKKDRKALLEHPDPIDHSWRDPEGHEVEGDRTLN